MPTNDSAYAEIPKKMNGGQCPPYGSYCTLILAMRRRAAIFKMI